MGLQDRYDEFNLTSPFLDISYRDIKVWHAIVLGLVWLVLWICIGTGLIYLYAVWFAAKVGFETALLVGVALMVLGLGSDE